MTVLTFYAKPGCHLCGPAREDVATVAAELGCELVEVDITTDPELFRRYGERIPVVAADGEELLELRVDAAGLRRALGRVGEP